MTRAPSGQTSDGFPVARYLVVIGIALAAYASLRPFHWTDRGVGPFAFLFTHVHVGWDLRWDLFLNVIGYLALGFAGVLAVAPRLRGAGAGVATILMLGAFSCVMEALQTYLPGRSPSVADFVTNVAGAVVGSLLGIMSGPWLRAEGGAAGLRRRFLVAGARGDFAIVVACIWLVGLAAPRILAFGMGDMRLALGVPARVGPSPASYVVAEAIVATLNLVVAAAFVRLVAREGRQARTLFVLFVAISFVARTSGYGLFWTSNAAFDWLTPGAWIGLAAGLVLGLLVASLEASSAAWIGLAALVLAAVLVNLAPPEPVIWTRARPREMDLAPLSVVTRSIAMLWPILAIVVFVWPRRRPAKAAA